MENSSDRFIFSRKELKRAARTSFKHHYLMFVFTCLIALILQVEFFASDNIISVRRQVISDAAQAAYELTGASSVKTLELFYTGIDEDADSLYKDVRQYLYTKSFENENTAEIFGRTKGTLNQIINFVAENTFVANIYSIITQFVGSESVARYIMIILILLVTVFLWLYFRNVYIAVSRRIFLEGRIYKKIPFSKYLFFIKMKRWTRASFAMGIKTGLEFLGMMTIVGWPVVHYGLFLVPYIVAENPDVRPFEAVKLSWNMMKGNKFKLFLLSLSFLGWNILGFLTLGLGNIFYANPYMISCYAEFYTELRKYCKEKNIPGTEMLNDTYLFVRADPNTLLETYEDVITELKKPAYSTENLETKRTKFFAKYFGFVITYSKDENEYEKREALKQRMKALKLQADGAVYPSRLSPIPEQRRITALDNIHYLRHYSLSSLTFMFFIFSFVGWAWELFYYFLMKGKLINRGVLHGPWLPIYGFGGVFILLLLNVFRKRPFVFTIMTMVLCGSVEYYTGVALEYFLHQKWWDYSGYFLNINGRICAEGLFVFAVAGVSFTYVFAPLLDNLIRKINKHILRWFCIALCALIIFDTIYTWTIKPNSGYGITGSFDHDEDPVYTEQTE
ncbi:MAG: DUF975 family protein [Clostridiales bacterium]|nr:DUF975 family protein [Clostridiales bacterium]